METERVAREACDRLPVGALDDRVLWLEKAARAGNVDAMIEFSWNGLEDMQNREDILLHFDEVTRRRDAANLFLQQALHAGRCSALRALEGAFSGRVGYYDWLATPDATKAAMYAEALDRWNEARGNPDDTHFEADAGELDAAASSRARMAGMTLFNSYCPEAREHGPSR